MKSTRRASSGARWRGCIATRGDASSSSCIGRCGWTRCSSRWTASCPGQGFILDLGCGYGMATHWLACFTDGRTFLGVDYDEEKIRVAQAHARRSIRAFGSRSATFSSANIRRATRCCCWTCCTTGRRRSSRLILNQARAALRPGGRLVLRDGVRAEDDRPSPDSSLGGICHARGHEPHAGRVAFPDAGGTGGHAAPRGLRPLGNQG